GVRINGVAVAAPKKLEALRENLGLQAGTKTSTLEEVESRGVPSYLIIFYGAGGQSAGSAHFLYTDGDKADLARTNAKGTLVYQGKSYSITAKDLDAIDAIAKEPLAF